MGAVYKRISLSKERRVICVSDIHGRLDLFQSRRERGETHRGH